MSRVTDTVEALALPVAQELGLEIWNVEYVKEAAQWFLRVYIDKEGGISIADCEAFSRALDPILDEADPIPGSYVFEVSSAGAERELKRPSDFARFIGSNVEVKLYKAQEGRKVSTGKLVGYHDGDVSISIADQPHTFEKALVASVHLSIV